MTAPAIVNHGTIYTYRKGCRCQECVSANYRGQKRWRVKAAANPIPPGVHGTINGYKIYGCRKPCCKKARAEEQAAMTERRRRMRALVAAGLPRDWEGDIPGYTPNP